MFTTERTYHDNKQVGPDAIFHFNAAQIESYVAGLVSSGWEVTGKNTTDDSVYVSLRHPSLDRMITLTTELA